MSSYFNVLWLAGDEREAMNLRQSLAQYVNLTGAQTLAELGELLKNREYDALFYVESLRTGNWNDVIPEVHKRDPDLPVIILSRTGVQRRWREALEAGAFDLLAPPFQEGTLVAVLEQAVASRQARARPVLSITPS